MMFIFTRKASGLNPLSLSDTCFSCEIYSVLETASVERASLDPSVPNVRQAGLGILPVNSVPAALKAASTWTRARENVSAR